MHKVPILTCSSWLPIPPLPITGNTPGLFSCSFEMGVLETQELPDAPNATFLAHYDLKEALWKSTGAMADGNRWLNAARLRTEL